MKSSTQEETVMRGWIALVVTLLLMTGGAWLVYKPNSNVVENGRGEGKDFKPNTPSQNNIQLMEEFINSSEKKMSQLELTNPLHARQAYYLRKHILRCSWNKMYHSSPSDVSFEQSLPYQSRCADELLDEVIDDGEFALLLAQAMKAVGVNLSSHYDELPSTWPNELSRSYVSKKFARVVGVF